MLTAEMQRASPKRATNLYVAKSLRLFACQTLTDKGHAPLPVPPLLLTFSTGQGYDVQCALKEKCNTLELSCEMAQLAGGSIM